MSEVVKIGVIYNSKPPQFLAEPPSGDADWQFEFIAADSILHTPVARRLDFLAVFFPQDECGKIRDHAARIFPSAQVVGYIESGADPRDERLEKRDGGLVATLPMSMTFARRIFGQFSEVHAGRQEHASSPSKSDDLETFLEAFIGMVESAWTAAERHPAMNLLLDKIRERFGAEECILYLGNESGQGLQRAYETGNIKDIDLFEHQANSSIVERVLKTGSPFLENDYWFQIRAPLVTEGKIIRSILSTPLSQRGDTIGVIELLNKSDGIFQDEDVKLLEMVVKPIAVAIGTIRMFDSAEALTITDDLTKLYNYRYLMQYLEAEVKRCLRYKKKVSLLFIDVDGFKQVNDTYGHLVGSRALAEMGQVLRKVLRETDIVGRYGGDEFVVVLPETPLNGALVIAERMRKKVDDYEFVAQDLSIHLTISLGVASCPKHTLTAEGLIKKADAAMYRAKELSRNSIKAAV